MNREPDEKIVENPDDEEATGTVLRLVPRAEREPKATRTAGQAGRPRAGPASDGDDDDPGPTPPSRVKRQHSRRQQETTMTTQRRPGSHRRLRPRITLTAQDHESFRAWPARPHTPCPTWPRC